MSFAGWEPVDGGQSGAVVLRSPDGSRFAKQVGPGSVESLAGERDRLGWLHTQGLACPEVIDWSESETGAVLVTSTLPGVGADRLSAADLERAWPAIADLVRAIHDLPVDRCPFRGGLQTMVARAEDVVARGAVTAAFLPVDQQGTPPDELLGRLRPELPARRADEARDHVVCHGDLTLANVLVDPESLDVTGVIDVDRLGVADPYADIALLLANARETWPDERTARGADEAFGHRYGIALDADRRRFYLSLDPLTWG